MTTAGADITARPIELTTLLDGIEQGKIVLPDFQRDFRWSEGEVASLVATAMMGWPAGSLLLMRGLPRFFNTRAFEEVPERSGQQVAYVVLDGQQRLTALYRALRGGTDAIYVVALDALESGISTAEEIEEAISVMTKTEWEAASKNYASGSGLPVPLTALKSASDFFEWRDAIAMSVPEGRRESLSSRLAAAFREWLGTITHYEFPAIILENDLPTEAVARIFERINRGGLQLSTFDLLVARAYTPDWNLRAEWDRARTETELVETYLGDDGLPVLQGMALREVGDVRRPALLNLSPVLIQSKWDEAVAAMEDACAFVAKSGMRDPDWLPYKTLLIPLAALARTVNLEDHRSQLDSWLWATSLGADYDVASSTKLARDFAALSEAITMNHMLTFDLNIDSLEVATRRQSSALWRAFLSLLLRAGAHDLGTGMALADEIGHGETRMVGSLFLRTSGSDPDAPHLRVLSQVLVRRGAGRQFRGRSLLSVLVETAGNGLPDFDSRLASQLLPPTTTKWFSGDPSEVLHHRLNHVRDYVEHEFGYIRLVHGSESGE
jgi:hypothetical protein